MSLGKNSVCYIILCSVCIIVFLESHLFHSFTGMVGSYKPKGRLLERGRGTSPAPNIDIALYHVEEHQHALVHPP